MKRLKQISKSSWLVILLLVTLGIAIWSLYVNQTKNKELADVKTTRVIPKTKYVKVSKAKTVKPTTNANIEPTVSSTKQKELGSFFSAYMGRYYEDEQTVSKNGQTSSEFYQRGIDWYWKYYSAYKNQIVADDRVIDVIDNDGNGLNGTLTLYNSKQRNTYTMTLKSVEDGYRLITNKYQLNAVFDSPRDDQDDDNPERNPDDDIVMNQVVTSMRKELQKVGYDDSQVSDAELKKVYLKNPGGDMGAVFDYLEQYHGADAAELNANYNE